MGLGGPESGERGEDHAVEEVRLPNLNGGEEGGFGRHVIELRAVNFWVDVGESVIAGGGGRRKRTV